VSVDEQGFFSSAVDEVRRDIRHRHRRYFSLLERTTRFCHSLRFTFTVDSEDGQKVFAVALFLKLLADVEAACLLLERGLTSQGRSMLRVATECLIVIANMANSDDFVRGYALSGEIQRLKLVKSIKNNPSPVFDELRAHFTDELVKQIATTIGDRKEESVKQWANNATVSWLYDGPYRLFCSEVHSGPPSLSYNLILDDKQHFEAFCYGPDHERDYRPDIMELLRLLLHGLAFVDQLFHFGREEQFRALKGEYDKLGELIPNAGV
jgi:hypothetical protein